MKLVESFLDKNPCFSSDRKIAVKGLMLQSVGCPQPSAKVFLNNWNRPSYNRSCPHAIVDAVDGTVYQTLPWNHRGWHAATVANDNYIGVVMCEPNQIKYLPREVTFNVVGDKAKAEDAARRAYYSSVDLFAMLCKEFNLDPASQIFFHIDLSTIGSPLTVKDPEHLWSQLDLPFTMNGFRRDVKVALDKLNGVNPTAIEATVVEGVSYEVEKTYAVSVSEEISVEEKANETAEDASFEVRIPVSNLRIRKGPGVGEGCEPIGQYTGIGTFRILEVQNGTGSKSGWGRLASGEGWICMDFVERI